MNERRTKIREMTETASGSPARIHNVLHEHLQWKIWALFSFLVLLTDVTCITVCMFTPAIVYYCVCYCCVLLGLVPFGLWKKRLCARWVPRLLTVNQTQVRVVVSIECLELHRRNPKAFLHSIGVDETWILFYTPETKEQSKKWTAGVETAPKTLPSTGKSYAVL